MLEFVATIAVAVLLLLGRLYVTWRARGHSNNKAPATITQNSQASAAAETISNRDDAKEAAPPAPPFSENPTLSASDHHATTRPEQRGATQRRTSSAAAAERHRPFDALMIPTNGHALTCSITVGKSSAADPSEDPCTMLGTQSAPAPWSTQILGHGLHPGARASLTSDFLVRHRSLAAFLVEVDPSDGEVVLVSDRDELHHRTVVPQSSIILSPAQQSVLVHQDADFRRNVMTNAGDRPPQQQRGRPLPHYRVGLLLQAQASPSTTPLLQRYYQGGGDRAPPAGGALSSARPHKSDHRGAATVVVQSPGLPGGASTTTGGSKRAPSSRAWSPSVIIMFQSRDDRIAFANALRDFVRRFEPPTATVRSATPPLTNVSRRLDNDVAESQAPPPPQPPGGRTHHPHHNHGTVTPLTISQQSSTRTSPSKDTSLEASLSPQPSPHRAAAATTAGSGWSKAQLEIVAAAFEAQCLGSASGRSQFWRDVSMNKFDQLPGLSVAGMPTGTSYVVHFTAAHSNDDPPTHSKPPAWLEALPSSSAAVSAEGNGLFRRALHHPSPVVLTFVCTTPTAADSISSSSSNTLVAPVVEVAVTLSSILAKDLEFTIVPSADGAPQRHSSDKAAAADVKGLMIRTNATPATCKIVVVAHVASSGGRDATLPPAHLDAFTAYFNEIVLRRLCGGLHQSPSRTLVRFLHVLDDDRAVLLAASTPRGALPLPQPPAAGGPLAAAAAPTTSSRILPLPELPFDAWCHAAELRVESHVDLMRDLLFQAQQRVDEEAAFRKRVQSEFVALQQRSHEMHKMNQELQRQKVEQQRRQDEWARQRGDEEVDAKLASVAAASSNLVPPKGVLQQPPSLVASLSTPAHPSGKNEESSEAGRSATPSSPPEEHETQNVEQTAAPTAAAPSMRNDTSHIASAPLPLPTAQSLVQPPVTATATVAAAPHKNASALPLTLVNEAAVPARTPLAATSAPPPPTPSVVTMPPPKEVYTRCESTPSRLHTAPPSAESLFEPSVPLPPSVPPPQASTHLLDSVLVDDLLVSASSIQSNSLAQSSRADVVTQDTDAVSPSHSQHRRGDVAPNQLTPVPRLRSEVVQTGSPIATPRPQLRALELPAVNITPRLGRVGSPSLSTQSPHLEKLRAAREEARSLLQRPTNTAAVQRLQQPPLLSARIAPPPAVQAQLLSLEWEESSQRAQNDAEALETLSRTHRMCLLYAAQLREKEATRSQGATPQLALGEVCMDEVLAMLSKDERDVRAALQASEQHKWLQLLNDAHAAATSGGRSLTIRLVNDEVVRRGSLEREAAAEWIALCRDFTCRHSEVLSRSGSRVDVEEQEGDVSPPWAAALDAPSPISSSASPHAEPATPPRLRTKPFHYATFEASDLVSYHTPVAAGDPAASSSPTTVQHANVVTEMLRCGVDRELRVVEPLLDGCMLNLNDVLLDLNGVSLHSHEHLREVLTERALLVKQRLLSKEPNTDVWTSGHYSTLHVREVTAEEYPMEAVVMRRSDVVVVYVRT